MAKDLTALFYPKSVAIVGASHTPGKVGAIILKNIIDSHFQGKIFPVNPTITTIGNLVSYPNLSAIPEVPDLAIVAIPSPQVIDTVLQAGEKGIKNIVILSAGFKETGPEGAALEKEIVNIATQYAINLIGPNCLGFVNNLAPINATFGDTISQSGNLRFISQSGAIATSLFDWCKSQGLYFSQFITLGNKAQISENDILEYWQSTSKDSTPNSSDLSSVSPIGLYLESIVDGERFLQITSQICKKDPIFILKPGKTSAGAKAMHSHTGAIAGEDAVLETALNQAGVIRCQTLEDFFDLSRAFAWEDAPAGPKVAVISNAGGPGVISADAVISAGLKLAEFDSATHEKLFQVLPRTANILNPVDVLGDALADRFTKAAEIVLESNQADALLVILTPQVMTEIEKTAEGLGNLSKKYHRPIFCSFIGGSKIFEGEQKLNSYKIPCFRFPERAIFAFSAMWRFYQHKNAPEELESNPPLLLQSDLEKCKSILENAQNKKQKTLDNLQANDLVSAAQFNTPPTTTVSTLEEALSFTKAAGYPVVLKLSSPGLLHKKAIGGVITKIGNDDQLDTAFSELELKIKAYSDMQLSIQIQKQVPGGIEVIIGVKKDPTFGPVLLFGAGGSWAEIISDRNLHLLPITTGETRQLVEKSKIFSLLKGNSGEPAYALEKLYDLIMRLGRLATDFPQISEIEINPAIVTLNNVWSVDAKVVLEESTPPQAPQFQWASVLNRQVLSGPYHYFEFLSPKPLTFSAGQYLSVKVAPNRINSYSIAGKTGPDKFNLLVDVSPGGPGSRFFANLEGGDKMTYLGPFGTFALNLNDSTKSLLFLATGSGFAPLKTMIEETLKGGSLVPISLYLGFDSPKDVFLQDYLKQLSLQYPNFSYKIAVDKPDENWQGEVGFITELIKKYISDASGIEAYLCGNKNMIADATNILLQKGLPKERIYTEKY